LQLAAMPNQLINDNASDILGQAVAHLRDRFFEAPHQRYFGGRGFTAV
jgi:hypothetical protein